MEASQKYQPSEDDPKSETKSSASSSSARKMLRTAALAITISLGSTIANPEGSLINAALLAEASRQNKISTEVKNISKSIMDNIAKSDSSIGVDSKYMKKILTEAEWVSKELKVKEAFVISQWFYETGGVQGFSQFMINKNNLGGFTSSKADGQISFDELHDFAKAYVKVLKRAGVEKADDFWQIINKLHKANYFSADKKRYGNGLISVLKVLKSADSRYDDYYNSIGGN